MPVSPTKCQKQSRSSPNKFSFGFLLANPSHCLSFTFTEAALHLHWLMLYVSESGASREEIVDECHWYINIIHVDKLIWFIIRDTCRGPGPGHPHHHPSFSSSWVWRGCLIDRQGHHLLTFWAFKSQRRDFNRSYIRVYLHFHTLNPRPFLGKLTVPFSLAFFFCLSFSFWVSPSHRLAPHHNRRHLHIYCRWTPIMRDSFPQAISPLLFTFSSLSLVSSLQG